MPFPGHLFVEGIIEQHDFACDFVPRQRFQLVEISDSDHLGYDSICRRRDACSERTKHNLLRRVLRLTGKLNERRRFVTTHPMWNHYSLELHFTADGLQFAGDVLNRFGRLRRSAQSRADVIGEMRDLPISVVAVQSCLLQSFQFRQCLQRKDSRCWRWRSARIGFCYGRLLRINSRSKKK